MTRLFDIPAEPQLTDRQTRALTIIQEAGPDGMLPAELGALLHGHARCDWCKSAGLEVLRRLRTFGLVRQRRLAGRMVWVAVGVQASTPAGMSEDIPF